MQSPSNPEISAPPAVAAADRLAFAVGAGEGGERLDRFLSQAAAARGLALSRTRLKALIEAGQATIDGAEARDPAARVAEGERIALAVPPAEDAAIAGEDLPLTIVFEDEHLLDRRQAGRARRPSRARPCRRDAGQRADPPLRRQPVGRRRGQAPGDRPSSRQGHLRPAGRRQERRRPPGPRGAVRRPRPQRIAQARISRARLGRARARGGNRRGGDRPPPVQPREDGGGRRQARPGGGHPLARRGTARPGEPRRLPAGDRTHPPDPRPSRPYRPSAARRFGLRSGFQDQGEPPFGGRRGRRSTPSAARPCTPRSSPSIIPITGEPLAFESPLPEDLNNLVRYLATRAGGRRRGRRINELSSAGEKVSFLSPSFSHGRQNYMLQCGASSRRRSAARRKLPSWRYHGRRPADRRR